MNYLGERILAVGVLVTAWAVACTGGVAPVLVGGPGPSDAEPDEGTPPLSPTSVLHDIPPGGEKPKVSLEKSGAATVTVGTTGATGATGAGGMGPTATSSGSGCTDTLNCKTCSQCSMGCGLPANANLCHCNAPMGKDSLSLYTAFGTCVCGATGNSGACGPLCAKTCTGTGTDSSSCQNCLINAVMGTCKTTYQACANDV